MFRLSRAFNKNNDNNKMKHCIITEFRFKYKARLKMSLKLY